MIGATHNTETTLSVPGGMASIRNTGKLHDNPVPRLKFTREQDADAVTECRPNVFQHLFRLESVGDIKLVAGPVLLVDTPDSDVSLHPIVSRDITTHRSRSTRFPHSHRETTDDP